jgi:acyl-CoA reductase-like NAD-dependent aldehyde dehydrogenase
VNTDVAIGSRIEIAFAEARSAQPSWEAKPLRARVKWIRRVRHLIADRANVIAKSCDAPLAETLIAQVLPLADACRFLERNAHQLIAARKLGRRGRPFWLHGVQSTIAREPFGIILIIAPANYPIFLPGVQLFQALLAGNAVLLKPGAGGDAAAVALRELCRAAGIDERLIVALPSSEAAAREAIALPIDKMVFTGSSEIGKEVLAQAASRIIPTVVELSGCDAAIIRTDADVRLAARALAFSLRFNKSATCIAPRRVIVARRCLEQLEAELATRIQAGRAESTDARLRCAIADSLAAGATPLVGDFGADLALHLPCVLTDVRPGMPVAQLDTFAPVLSIIAVDSDHEAIRMANASPFALGACVFSRDRRVANAIASRLNAGIVTINDLIVPTADPRVPFGGRKQSGFGVTRGAEGLLEMTQPKVIQVRRGKKHSHFDIGLTNRSSGLFAAIIEMTHGSHLSKRLHAFRRLLPQLKKTRWR